MTKGPAFPVEKSTSTESKIEMFTQLENENMKPI